MLSPELSNSSPFFSASFFAFASAARSLVMSCQAEITPAQISAGKVPPITGPPW